MTDYKPEYKAGITEYVVFCDQENFALLEGNESKETAVRFLEGISAGDCGGHHTIYKVEWPDAHPVVTKEQNT